MLDKVKDGSIVSTCNLTDAVHGLVDCGVRGVFIAITELDILVFDLELRIQVAQRVLNETFFSNF